MVQLPLFNKVCKTIYTDCAKNIRASRETIYMKKLQSYPNIDEEGIIDCTTNNRNVKTHGEKILL